MRTFLVASLFVLPAFLACRAENVTCVNDPALGACTAASSDGGSSSVVDAGFDVVAPPGCDPTKSPKDSAACIDGAVGMFVAPNGDDSAAGTKTLPLKTIAKGVEAAAAKGLPRVYVCEGTYGENVEVKSPVSISAGSVVRVGVDGCEADPADVEVGSGRGARHADSASIHASAPRRPSIRTWPSSDPRRRRSRTPPSPLARASPSRSGRARADAR